MAFVKKNGLLYSEDLHTVLGVDDSSDAFTGRIPYGAHAIDDEVFSECPYESISVPDSVKKLGNKVFENSTALEKVKLSSSLQVLPSYLFRGCSALTKVVMPEKLASYSEGLFMDCASLLEIPFRAGIEEIPANFMEGCKSVKAVVFPLDVTEIGPRAAARCTSLESVVFPAGITQIALDAFEGCTALSSIRIDGESELFYIGSDGSLYAKEDDQLIVKNCADHNQTVSFFDNNLDETADDNSDDDDFEEDDTFFSVEIGASDMEIDSVGLSNKVENIKPTVQEIKMADESNVDSMLADIMGEEKQRTSTSAPVVSEQESKVMSDMLDIMSDAPANSSKGAVSTDELEQLFAKNEESEPAGPDADVNTNSSEKDKKTQILIDSVEFSKILEFEPKGEAPEDADLFVVAEKTITGEDGQKAFSSKLELCCKKFAAIHDFKRVILLAGLPLDNDEFMQFYFHFISKKNVILACEASCPSKLSDYCKTICEESRISLETKDLLEQRKLISVKTDNLIKLIIQDIY